ncbi:MAG: SRPBCC family protein [Actinomycetota bacterium]|nr:SRPBCC family protein [Actinomycetota bacterium]
MPRVEFDMESELPPDRIRAALIDFTDRRPEIWPGLSAKEYRVYEVGDTWADVREGNGGNVWARERYDWSSPDTVTWTVVESGFCRPGSFVSARITPRDGGSRIHVTWDRRPSTVMYRLGLGIIKLTGGAPVKSSIRKGLARIAAQSPPGSP